MLLYKLKTLFSEYNCEVHFFAILWVLLYHSEQAPPTNSQNKYRKIRWNWEIKQSPLFFLKVYKLYSRNEKLLHLNYLSNYIFKVIKDFTWSTGECYTFPPTIFTLICIYPPNLIVHFLLLIMLIINWAPS